MDGVTSHFRPSDHECYDVLRFHLKFGMIAGAEPQHLTRRKLTERVACMMEEIAEFAEAADKQDLAGMADALVDLVYFAKGTAVQLGLGAIWNELWDDVQRANLSKERGVGKRGQTVDCIKPEGWVPPQTMEILLAGGYEKERFCEGPDEVIQEALCVDDEVSR